MIATLYLTHARPAKLRSYFEKFGKLRVVRAHVMTNSRGLSRHFGFVEFATHADATAALAGHLRSGDNKVELKWAEDRSSDYKLKAAKPVADVDVDKFNATVSVWSFGCPGRAASGVSMLAAAERGCRTAR